MSSFEPDTDAILPQFEPDQEDTRDSRKENFYNFCNDPKVPLDCPPEEYFYKFFVEENIVHKISALIQLPELVANMQQEMFV